jgi:hypothetical protein
MLGVMARGFTRRQLPFHERLRGGVVATDLPLTAEERAAGRRMSFAESEQVVKVAAAVSRKRTKPRESAAQRLARVSGTTSPVLCTRPLRLTSGDADLSVVPRLQEQALRESSEPRCDDIPWPR